VARKVKNLARLIAEKLPPAAREKLMAAVIEFIVGNAKPQKLIFFGSIVTDHFDIYSDIDVVAVYDSVESADLARRVLYSGIRRPDLGYSIEILCVDAKTFEEKSRVGGVYFSAADLGRVVLPPFFVL
jgi:predicted nucleotidyltransferase